MFQLNGTTPPNNNTVQAEYEYYRRHINAYYLAHTFFLAFDVVGSFLALWMFLSLVTCAKMRERFQIKLLLQYLATAVALLGVLGVMEFTAHAHKTFKQEKFHCRFYSVSIHLRTILKFSFNWTLVLIMSFYLVDNLHLNPRIPFKASFLKFGTFAILLSPFVLGAVIWSPILVHFDNMKNVTTYAYCNFVPDELNKAMTSLNLIVPVSIGTTIILFIALIRSPRSPLKIRRFESLTDKEGQLGPHLDGMRPYAVAMTVHFLTNSLDLFGIYFMYDNHFPFLGWIVFNYLRMRLANLAITVSPLPWLLVPDVRERFKSFRAWRKSPTKTDILMMYDKETDKL